MWLCFPLDMARQTNTYLYITSICTKNTREEGRVVVSETFWRLFLIDLIDISGIGHPLWDNTVWLNTVAEAHITRSHFCEMIATCGERKAEQKDSDRNFDCCACKSKPRASPCSPRLLGRNISRLYGFLTFTTGYFSVTCVFDLVLDRNLCV